MEKLDKKKGSIKRVNLTTKKKTSKFVIVTSQSNEK